MFDNKVHFGRRRDVLPHIRTQRSAICVVKRFLDRRLIMPHIGSRKRISHSIDIVDKLAIQDVVKSFSRFYHHLELTRDVKMTKVRIELKKVKKETKNFSSLFTPIGKNLITSEPVEIVIDKGVKFGITIFNDTKASLYPYLFYFNPTDLRSVCLSFITQIHRLILCSSMEHAVG